MLHVSDATRRARIGRRHALAPAHRVDDVSAATRAMTVLHATEPATVHLSAWCRVQGLDHGDVDRALVEERSVVKQLAMRRTLFVFPRDLLPAALGSAARRTASSERASLLKGVVATGLADDAPGAEAWLARVTRSLLDLLDEHGTGPEGLQTTDLRRAVPELDVTLTLTGGSVPATSRVLTLLGAEGRIVRGANAGHWRISRPRWSVMGAWLGETPEPLEASEGYREIVRRWLTTFGPGTETDLVWWLGATKGILRTALAELEAVEVALDGGGSGWVLPEDMTDLARDHQSDDEPWAALLPVLDPTVMGWKERDFYLGPHAPALFDRNGNAGTTAWVDGRVVGCWTQDAEGGVRVHLLEDVDAAARRHLDAEATRLTGWLAGERVGTVYPSAAMKMHRDLPAPASTPAPTPAAAEPPAGRR